MKILFVFVSSIFFGLIGKCQSSFYALRLDSLAGGKSIDLSKYLGKKVLIVNVASQDSNFNQYEELKALQYLYPNTLAIIVVPTNSFSTESGPDSALGKIYNQGIYKPFPVTGKMEVTGSNIHPLYQWLTQKSLNGMFDSVVKGPFQKYLINKDGKLVGVFNSKIHPLSPELRKTLDNSY